MGGFSSCRCDAAQSYHSQIGNIIVMITTTAIVVVITDMTVSMISSYV